MSNDNSDMLIIRSQKTSNKQVPIDTLSDKEELNEENENEEKEEKEEKEVEVNISLLNYEKIKKENDEYNNILITNENNLKKEIKNTLLKVKEINNEIKLKNKKINKLKNENNQLFENLNDIKEEVDKHLKLLKTKKINEYEKIKKEEKIKKDIKVAEKEIEIIKKEIEIKKKEKENLEKIFNSNNSNTKTTKNEKLMNLNSIIGKKEKEIKEEKEELKLHELCKKKTRNLKNQKQLLKNQLDFEKKKTSLLEYQVQNTGRTISDDLEYLDDLSIENRNNLNSKRNKSEIYLKQKKLKKKKNNIKLLIKPIINELDESDIKNIKDKYSKNKSVKDIKTMENDRIKYGLFNPKEFEILSQIIPNESLNNYREKYDQLEIEKNEIEDLFQKNKPLKKEINNNQFKILKSDLMLKSQNKEESQLKCNYLKNKKIENNISKEIKDILKEIDKYKYILKMKMNENIILKNDINDIKVKIERGELICKKGNNEEIEKENEEEEIEEEENVKLNVNDKYKYLNNNNYENRIENE